MDSFEAHRLAFVLGMKMQDQRVDEDELFSTLRSLGSYCGNQEMPIGKESIRQPHLVSLALEQWGQNTLAEMIISGYHWYLLASYSRWLLLPENERKLVSNDEPLESIYNSVYHYIQNNTTHFVFNYFFEFPIQESLEYIFSTITAQIRRKAASLADLNPQDVARELHIAVNVVKVLAETGAVTRPVRIQANIDRRTVFRSRIRAFLVIIPPLLILPPLILLALMIANIGLSLEEIIPSLITLSGGVSAVGIALKLVYEAIVPRMQQKLLLTDLKELKTAEIFLDIFNANKGGEELRTFDLGFERGDTAVSYPITKYFLTNRKIEPWKHYTRRFSGEDVLKLDTEEN
ncbi:MAG: hypothetical protein ACFFD4_08940 [Candidatus Odinarchaeota archaeon]